jgi:hypothetical protein
VSRCSLLASSRWSLAQGQSVAIQVSLVAATSAVARSSNDADDRVLAPAKCNLAAMPGSLAFELDEVEFEEGPTAVLRLLCPSSVTARDLLADAEGAAKPPEKRSTAATGSSPTCAGGRAPQPS